MTNEEINALYDKAEMEYEMIKDKCHDLYDENKHLNLQLDQALKDYENAVSDYEQEHYKIVKAIEYLKMIMMKKIIILYLKRDY